MPLLFFLPLIIWMGLFEVAQNNEEPRYLQSTGFLLDPDGRVLNAVYSNGPIGRLVAEDVIGMVTYLKSKA